MVTTCGICRLNEILWGEKTGKVVKSRDDYGKKVVNFVAT
jgi:hypothetical protein